MTNGISLTKFWTTFEEHFDEILIFVDDIGINLGPSGNDFGINFESFSHHSGTDF